MRDFASSRFLAGFLIVGSTLVILALTVPPLTAFVANPAGLAVAVSGGIANSLYRVFA